MKKLLISFLFIVSVITLLASEKTQDDTKLSRSEKKAAKRELVKAVVESKSFTVVLERLYMPRYGMIDLNTSSNFIVIDGDKAYVRAAYMGRQRSFKPIAGINVSGQASFFKMEKNSSKGTYSINMEVKGDNDIFHIYLFISENGNCNTTISANYIDSVRYSGRIILKKKKEKVPEPDAIRI